MSSRLCIQQLSKTRYWNRLKTEDHTFFKVSMVWQSNCSRHLNFLNLLFQDYRFQQANLSMYCWNVKIAIKRRNSTYFPFILTNLLPFLFIKENNWLLFSDHRRLLMHRNLCSSIAVEWWMKVWFRWDKERLAFTSGTECGCIWSEILEHQHAVNRPRILQSFSFLPFISGTL